MNARVTSLLACTSVLTLGLAGCGVTLADEWHPFPQILPDTPLHQPYAVGVEDIEIYAFNGPFLGGSGGEDWKAESSNDDIFKVKVAGIDDSDRFVIHIKTLRAGKADLLITENGLDLVTQEVKVVKPKIDIIPTGRAQVTLLEDCAAVKSPLLLLEDNKATFVVRYEWEDEMVYGDPNIKIDSDAEADEIRVVDELDITALGDDLLAAIIPNPFPDTSPVQTPRFFKVAPEGSGTFSATIQMGKEDIKDFEVETVSEGAFEKLKLEAGDEALAEEGDPVSVWAVALDDDDNLLYGYLPTWKFGSDKLPNPGDILTYSFNPSLEETAKSTFDGESESVVVHGDEPVVGTSDVTDACDQTASSTWAAFSLLAGALLWGSRRRRRVI